MPMRTQAHEGGTNVTIHLGKQFLILHLEYAFYNALLHSFTRNYGDKKSRPDHVLLSPALLYKLVCSFKMWDTCASDHAALSTEFRVNVVGGESANTKHHVCRIGQCVNNLVLRWQHEKADVYARHISENIELLAQFYEAERAGDVDKLAFCVRSLIVQAASSRAVGMSAQARCL